MVDVVVCSQEFIEGAAKLRGSAKALDIWRMETKIEARGLLGAEGFSGEHGEFMGMIHKNFLWGFP